MASRVRAVEMTKAGSAYMLIRPAVRGQSVRGQLHTVFPHRRNDFQVFEKDTPEL